MKIELFTPLRYNKYDLDSCKLMQYSDGINHLQYASKGRYSIIHILHSLSIYKGKVLISGYMCPTVEESLIKSGFTVGYFDIDLRDLNPSVSDINNCLSNELYVAVVAPSLYGNPADLEAIHAVCKRHNVIMIDDAAQSCGASLNGKKVGGFGDGGFFSFSPGKPTAGHMGSFFWSRTSNNYRIQRCHHPFLHRATHIEYLLNRYYIYMTPRLLRSCVSLMCRPFIGHKDIMNDDICIFEKRILGGIVFQNEEIINSRNAVLTSFLDEFEESHSLFRIVRNIRGERNSSKIVLLFNDRGTAEVFKSHLDCKGVSYYGGYQIPETITPLINCRTIDGCIVEMPLELNANRMKYLFDVVKEFVDNKLKNII